MASMEWGIHHLFYIPPSESTNQMLSNNLLVGGNCHSWSREARRSLGSKNKLYFIDDILGIVKPSVGDKLYDYWKQANDMVVT